MDISGAQFGFNAGLYSWTDYQAFSNAWLDDHQLVWSRPSPGAVPSPQTAAEDWTPNTLDEIRYGHKGPWSTMYLAGFKRREAESWAADNKFASVLEDWLRLAGGRALVHRSDGLLYGSDEALARIREELIAFVRTQMRDYVAVNQLHALRPRRSPITIDEDSSEGGWKRLMNAIYDVDTLLWI